MVEEWAAANGCTEKLTYANDGSVIADWSHLLLSRGEFKAALEGTSLGLCAGLPETVTQYVFEHSDLNRVPYEDVVTGVKLLRDMEILQVRLAALAATSEQFGLMPIGTLVGVEARPLLCARQRYCCVAVLLIYVAARVATEMLLLPRQVHALKERGTNMTEAAFRGLVKALPRCTHFRLGEITILARKQSLDA